MVGCWREPSSGLQVADHGCILTHVKSRVEEASCLVILWLHCKACGILVPWPGFEPMPPAVEAQSPNHWTTSKLFFNLNTLTLSSCCSLRPSLIHIPQTQEISINSSKLYKRQECSCLLAASCKLQKSILLVNPRDLILVLFYLSFQHLTWWSLLPSWNLFSWPCDAHTWLSSHLSGQSFSVSWKSSLLTFKDWSPILTLLPPLHTFSGWSHKP